MAIFQTALGSGVFSDPGADVTKPLLIPSATTPTGSGVPVTPGKLGTVMSGDLGTEFVLGKLVLAANTDLLYGQAYQLDKDYNLTALTTANWVTQSEVVFSQCFAPATLAAPTTSGARGQATSGCRWPPARPPKASWKPPRPRASARPPARRPPARGRSPRRT